ncbi:ImuA family protein [Nitratireductor alexandrii]|uniref:ImuA family protein n=1 Tax=Nitratireductor alexandrii TaxID=2448161 RepID=UPI0013DEF136|nr:hypothetical protein [Nitratireductor alexandrii]
MAKPAMARETVVALRRQIARIEGSLPERLAQAGGDDGLVLRHGPAARREPGFGTGFLPTGAASFDAALGAGLPPAALVEIHGRQTRDAGAVAGFALCLAALVRRSAPARPDNALCWIGTAEIFREAGLPYAPGLSRFCGLPAGALFLCAPNETGDALWIAEQAARQRAFAAVVLELRGNPARLDLTATRRLHRRAQEAGRSVFLIREAGTAEPTAAPVRIAVSPAPAARRSTVSGPVAASIGHPAFAVTVTKSRAAPAGRLVLEWNPDASSFCEIRPEDSGALVAASGHRPDSSAARGAVVALRPAVAAPAAPGQPSREQRPAHRRARRAR